MQAYSRLMIEFQLRIENEAKFRDHFVTLCDLINFEGEENSRSEQDIAIAKFVLEIVKHIVK